MGEQEMLAREISCSIATLPHGCNFCRWHSNETIELPKAKL